MAGLPGGTVTFLFTDVEGSTRLWEADPEAMSRALARHDELLRTAIEDAGGYVFATAGDAFCAAFEDPDAAVGAAVRIQQELVAEDWGATPIRVRAALCSGRPEQRDGDYFGPVLNRTARLLNTGHGGQVLVSDTTKALLTGGDWGLVDLGEHRLRDLTSCEHVFQLQIPGLPAEFPPIRSLGAYVHNLPAQFTSFVGRADETAMITKLLADDRTMS